MPFNPVAAPNANPSSSTRLTLTLDKVRSDKSTENSLATVPLKYTTCKSSADSWILAIVELYVVACVEINFKKQFLGNNRFIIEGDTKILEEERLNVVASGNKPNNLKALPFNLKSAEPVNVYLFVCSS